MSTGQASLHLIQRQPDTSIQTVVALLVKMDAILQWSILGQLLMTQVPYEQELNL